jgi:hypothetical protein
VIECGGALVLRECCSISRSALTVDMEGYENEEASKRRAAVRAMDSQTARQRIETMCNFINPSVSQSYQPL